MKLLVTGAGGMLAQAVIGTARASGHEVVALTRSDLDITDAAAVTSALHEHRPDAVVHCAAFTRVDNAEHDEARAFAVNAEGTAHVARAATAVGARLVYPGTDYVFDGTARSPYRPDDTPAPLNAYGRSKLAGEDAAREAGSWIIVRTSWLYGAGGRNFVSTILQRARAGESLRVVDDQVGSPTWTEDLAAVLLTLCERAPDGVYHACNRGETNWYGFARAALQAARCETGVEPVSSSTLVRPARRPVYSVLDCSTTERYTGPLPQWKDSLIRAIEAGL